MSHYDTLGVTKDADQVTIKRAYRRKSKAAHPDRAGGDHSSMVALNRAYDTLSNPAKRARYDQTGEDGAAQKSTDGMARDAVMQIFMAVVEKAHDYDDVISQVRAALGQNLTKIRGEITAAAKRITRLERSLKRLKYKGSADNFLAALLADQIGKTNAVIENLREGVTVVERAQEMLSAFTWQADPRPMTGQFTVFINAPTNFEADLAEALRAAVGNPQNESTQKGEA